MTSEPCQFCDNFECDCGERVTCAKVGQPGHLGCGWCTVHAGPRFECLDRCGHWLLATVFETNTRPAWFATTVDNSVGTYGGSPREAWKELMNVASVRPRDEAIAKLILPAPIPVVVSCPTCETVHLDEGEFAKRPHRTHQCQRCHHEWRPFEIYTVGVLSR